MTTESQVKEIPESDVCFLDDFKKLTVDEKSR